MSSLPFSSVGYQRGSSQDVSTGESNQQNCQKLLTYERIFCPRLSHSSHPPLLFLNCYVFLLSSDVIATLPLKKTDTGVTFLTQQHGIKLQVEHLKTSNCRTTIIWIK